MRGYDTKYEYKPEIEKLAKGLIEKSIDFEFLKFLDGFQVIVFENGVRMWDAVCHNWSYGHEEGLLEVDGTVSMNEDDVEGWLTAQKILDRL